MRTVTEAERLSAAKAEVRIKGQTTPGPKARRRDTTSLPPAERTPAQRPQKDLNSPTLRDELENRQT